MQLLGSYPAPTEHLTVSPSARAFPSFRAIACLLLETSEGISASFWVSFGLRVLALWGERGFYGRATAFPSVFSGSLAEERRFTLFDDSDLLVLCWREGEDGEPGGRGVRPSRRGGSWRALSEQTTEVTTPYVSSTC